MIMNNKILAVALIGVLMGVSAGAIAMRSSSPASTTPLASSSNWSDNNLADTRDAKYMDASNSQLSGQPAPGEFKTAEEQNAYKIGFADGFQSATERGKDPAVRSTRTSSGSVSSSHRVYYDYNQKHGRTFWQKHRDKLTMAIGTGGGTLMGGLIGGKKGAGIGALAGLGGSALYTYKLRNRNQR